MPTITIQSVSDLINLPEPENADAATRYLVAISKQELIELDKTVKELKSISGMLRFFTVLIVISLVLQFLGWLLS